ncbi:O-antigen ligase family protein [Colwellia echini]|uniref:O-antigen ligase family protein n=1 Tax=Colwellia echini TaxID=1982103 RepID=A0ABY3MUG7_9GAMM|nr:O-antigen ligase family protein [Colwellia echini]TYK64764.1 O-antigen ligase family protein [Colwellia echini]
MNKFFFYCLCSLIIYAPIPLGANRIWASSSIEFFVFLLFFGHLMASLSKRQNIFPNSDAIPVIIPLGITAAWLVLQITPGIGSILERPFSTLSFDPSLTHIMLLKTLALTLFAWLVFYYVNTRDLVYKFSLSIMLSGLLQALYASWLNLNLDMPSLIFDIPYSTAAVGSFIYKNQLANYLALCLAIGIGVLISQLSVNGSSVQVRHKVRDIFQVLLSSKILMRLSLIIMIIALILTRSRMGNSAFFFALAAISLFSFFFYNRKPKNLRLLILSFFILDLILVGTIFGVEKVKERLLETSLASETRDEVVRDAIPMILDYPVFGSGGGSFYSSFPQYQTGPYSGFYDHAHNDYIQFSVELGLPITLLLGAMVLYCLFISLKTMVKRKTPLYQGVSFGCAAAIVHMLLHSTVDFSLQSPAIALLFISILSLCLICAKLKR